jgi:hypothetical protein
MEDKIKICIKGMLDLKYRLCLNPPLDKERQYCDNCLICKEINEKLGRLFNEDLKKGETDLIKEMEAEYRKNILSEIKQGWREKCKRMEIMTGEVAIYELDKLMKDLR